MGSIGELLKSTREAKGITLEKAEEDTKIRKRYLEALEEGNYDIIPGRVYARGFLRNYSNYLGLDQDEIMIEYKLLGMPVKDEYSRTDIQASLNRARSSRRSGKKTYLLTVGVAVLAIATLMFYNFVYKNTTETADVETGKPPVNEQAGKQADSPGKRPVENSVYSPPNPDAPASVPPGTAGSSDNGSGQDIRDVQDSGRIVITLNGKDEVCWARVTVDGQRRFSGNINPGESRTFAGINKVEIKLGNAGAVEVIENGSSLGTLGIKGQVVTRQFSAGTTEYSPGQEGRTSPAEPSSQ